ncbi:aminoglycoside phosphotransferase family protein [Winogradskya humida]|uniref:Aminoglycoside phosphotransferase domain-containing protein n=1 Tax=Winogradskya humida TaxID=113566 RepID=A0ABQ3ZQG6_9ACTN|nr:aminoglycoside phosphotransferase family protein [Actinoplanes humidus]GIE20826.1 hypothetical protein Ahu01nite_039280 [Actinoplanes humidus]
MLTPPDDLDERLVVAAFEVGPLTYEPVGWGSHHWSTADKAYFVTVDEVADGLGYERLRRALDVAAALAKPFVVAPVRPLRRVGDRYAAALYAYITGQSFGFGPWPSEAHRAAVLDMLVEVHTAPQRSAAVDDFALPHRDDLFADHREPAGPYTERAVRLIAQNAESVRELLRRYDALVAGADRSRAVLTHGEPHPGNTMLAAGGWKLIDWETALLAPPERDLWLVGGDLKAWTEATGIEVVPAMLELYRLRWQLNDLCVDLHRFLRPHTGSADDVETWKLVQANVLAVTNGT